MDFIKLEKIREQFIGREDWTFEDILNAEEDLTVDEVFLIQESLRFINSVEELRKLADRTYKSSDKDSEEYKAIKAAKKEYVETLYDEILSIKGEDGDLQESAFIVSRYGGATNTYVRNAVLRLFLDGELTKKEVSTLFAKEFKTRLGNGDAFDTYASIEMDRQLRIINATLSKNGMAKYDIENVISMIKKQFQKENGDTQSPKRNFKKMERIRNALLGRYNVSTKEILSMDDSLSKADAALIMESLELIDEDDEEQYGRIIDLIREGKGHDLRTIMFLTTEDSVSDYNSIDNVVALLNQGYIDADDVIDLYVEDLEESFGTNGTEETIEQHIQALEEMALKSSEEDLKLSGEFTVRQGASDIRRIIEGVRRRYGKLRKTESINPVLSPKSAEEVSDESVEFGKQAEADNERGDSSNITK